MTYSVQNSLREIEFDYYFGQYRTQIVQDRLGIVPLDNWQNTICMRRIRVDDHHSAIKYCEITIGDINDFSLSF